jgi:hypothetical protein
MVVAVVKGITLIASTREELMALIRDVNAA